MSPMSKLTMVTVNGRTKFLMLPVDSDGKVRCDIYTHFNIRPRIDCVCMGYIGR